MDNKHYCEATADSYLAKIIEMFHDSVSVEEFDTFLETNSPPPRCGKRAIEKVLVGDRGPQWRCPKHLVGINPHFFVE
jgi:hypothetical protein